MLRHYLIFILLSLSLLMYSPVQGEMSIGINSSLDTLDYDLDNIHLKLEKLDTRWQFSASADGQLLVEHLRARRLVITMRGDSKKSGGSELPNQIKPPFPINIQLAEVAEVIIVTPTERHVIMNVRFALKADAKTLRLNMLRASTYWGEAEVMLNMASVKPFPLSGTVSLKQASGSIPYNLTANLSGDLNTLHFKSASLLALQGDQLAILQADGKVLSPAAHFRVDGELGLAGDYPLRLDARITDFHPDRLGNYPAAAFNFDLNLQGRLGSDADVPASLQVQFSSRDSQWQGHYLSTTGKFTLEGTLIRSIDFQADMPNNTIRANGSLGGPDSHLEWCADLRDLTKLGAQYSGEVHADGTLEGRFENFALRFNLLAQKLRLPGDLKLEKLYGQATFMAGIDGKVEAELKAVGLQYQQDLLLDGNITLQGTRISHQLQINAKGNGLAVGQKPAQSLEQSPKMVLQFQSVLLGGWVEDHWQGLIQSLVYKGETRLALEAPAILKFSRSDLNIESAVLKLAKGHAFIDNLNIGEKGFSSEGHLAQVGLDDLPSGLIPLPLRLEGNTVFSGKWQIDAGETLNGNISLWRESGDLILTNVDGTTKALGLEEVKAELKFKHNNAEFIARLAGQNLGSFSAHLTTSLTRIGSGFTIMANAPLKLTSAAQLNTLDWLLLPPSLIDASISGELTMDLQANGTILKPNLSGNVTGKNLQFLLPSSNIALADGRLAALFENDQLRITEAVWKSGEGYLRTSGFLSMENKRPKIDLDWMAQQFTAVSGADRLLILSGAGKTTLIQDILALSGDFTVVKGRIELEDEDAPTLGDDVVLLGKVESVPEQGLEIMLKGLRISLGENFSLHGHGLDAKLTGGITLTGLTRYSPHTEGSIKIIKGTYMAYGQMLQIERGILSFNGPADNPGLNIRAMRTNKSASASIDIAENISPPVNGSSSSSAASSGSDYQVVSAGVEISGSAFQPKVKLVSEPNVSDTEKLSWLILGHGIDQVGGKQFSMLPLAVNALLTEGKSVPIQTQLANFTGLDEISVSGEDVESIELTVGKRLTSQLYISYAKSMNGLLNLARLTFYITPRWAIQAETGTESAVDALYTFSFE